MAQMRAVFPRFCMGFERFIVPEFGYYRDKKKPKGGELHEKSRVF